MSMKLGRDGFGAAAQGRSDAIESLLDIFVGVFDKKQEPTEIDGIKHIDTKTILSMSDDQRMDLYNKIIKHVMGDKTNESA